MASIPRSQSSMLHVGSSKIYLFLTAVIIIILGNLKIMTAFQFRSGLSLPQIREVKVKISPQPQETSTWSRDALLRQLFGVISGIGLGLNAFGLLPAQALRPPSNLIPPPAPSPRPFLWQVLMTDPPQLQPYTQEGERAVLRDLARKCNAIFLGEHPESAQDHKVQVEIIKSIKKYKPRDAGVVIGLEMVQQKFQSVLDDYIQQKSSATTKELDEIDQQLKVATEWESRSPYPFESYLPIFHLAREEKMRLLALGIESEALSKVREVGLEGLSAEERGVYVADPAGFIQSVKSPAFKIYAERFIMPSYAARAEAAMLGAKPPSPAKFLAARMLWDESMATIAARHLQEQPRDIVIMLVNADHVKFGMGAPVRLERLLRSSNEEIRLAPQRGAVKSILLNPSPEDTGSSTARLRLTLGYAANLDKCRPVADFLWYSSYPKVAWLEHPQNPISLPYQEDDTLFQVFPGQR